MFPEGVTTRIIEVGPASDLTSGVNYAIRVLVTPSRSLVWDSEPVLPALSVFNVEPGETGLLELPVTDQSGYRDSSGNVIVLEPGQHAFYYKINVYYLRGGSVVSQKPAISVVLPTGPTPVDIDEMVSFKAGMAGKVISVPDSWSEDVTEAVAAANAAIAAVGGKLDSVVAGSNITVDNTDANNPVINAESGLMEYNSRADLEAVRGSEIGILHTDDFSADTDVPNAAVPGSFVVVSNTMTQAGFEYLVMQTFIVGNEVWARNIFSLLSSPGLVVQTPQKISMPTSVGVAPLNSVYVVGRESSDGLDWKGIQGRSTKDNNTLVLRDSSGRAEITTPTSANQIANKSYVDNAATSAASSKVDNVVAGTNVTVDNTDPNNPVVSAVSPPSASETTAGVIEIATLTEVIEGTDGTKAVVPTTLNAVANALQQEIADGDALDIVTSISSLDAHTQSGIYMYQFEQNQDLYPGMPVNVYGPFANAGDRFMVFARTYADGTSSYVDRSMPDLGVVRKSVLTGGVWTHSWGIYYNTSEPRPFVDYMSIGQNDPVTGARAWTAIQATSGSSANTIAKRSATGTLGVANAVSGTDAVNLTTLNTQVPAASTSTAGKVSLATTAEATTGTNTTKAVTPAGVKAVADLKANLASPALTGTPTAPTAAAGTNTTQLATTAFVTTAASTKLDTSAAPELIRDTMGTALIGGGGIAVQASDEFDFIIVASTLSKDQAPHLVNKTFTSSYWISEANVSLRDSNSVAMPITVDENVTINQVSFCVATAAAAGRTVSVQRCFLSSGPVDTWTWLSAETLATGIDVSTTGVKTVTLSTPYTITPTGNYQVIGFRVVEDQTPFDPTLTLKGGRLVGPGIGLTSADGFSGMGLPVGATANVTGVPVIRLRRSA